MCHGLVIHLDFFLFHSLTNQLTNHRREFSNCSCCGEITALLWVRVNEFTPMTVLLLPVRVFDDEKTAETHLNEQALDNKPTKQRRTKAVVPTRGLRGKETRCEFFLDHKIRRDVPCCCCCRS